MPWSIIQLSDKDFHKIADYITARYGIYLPVEKKILIQSRLQKRLKELNLVSFRDYRELLKNSDSRNDELKIIANYISTNHTSFFRENSHFFFLKHQVLPAISDRLDKNHSELIRIWSAGCSSGEEAYSIAMITEEFRLLSHCAFDFQIDGTDISFKVLNFARNAVYPYADSEAIPDSYRKLFLLRNKGAERKYVRICPTIRKRVFFSYGNLMDDYLASYELYDFIFLRNTLMYFHIDIQHQVLSRILQSLKPSGYLFVGHVESLLRFDLPLIPVAPGIYRKIE